MGLPMAYPFISSSSFSLELEGYILFQVHSELPWHLYPGAFPNRMDIAPLNLVLLPESSIDAEGSSPFLFHRLLLFIRLEVVAVFLVFLNLSTLGQEPLLLPFDVLLRWRPVFLRPAVSGKDDVDLLLRRR
jgi:hypothetical protein